MEKRVLFVCAGNTCRSPMAAALARARGISAESAGIECGTGASATANAIAVMRERGLDLRNHRSRDVEDVDTAEFAVVVAMAPAIAQHVNAPVSGRIVRWNVADPYGCPVQRYREVATEIYRLLNELEAELE